MRETVTFASPEHKQRFMETMEKIRRPHTDGEYASALYVLTAHISTWNQAEEYVSGVGIDFESLLTYSHFSGAYSVLIEWASGLFNGNTSIVPNELMRLDESNFQLALNALHIRRYGLQISESIEVTKED